jgi:hypothetical protein
MHLTSVSGPSSTAADITRVSPAVHAEQSENVEESASNTQMDDSFLTWNQSSAGNLTTQSSIAAPSFSSVNNETFLTTDPLFGSGFTDFANFDPDTLLDPQEHDLTGSNAPPG